MLNIFYCAAKVGAHITNGNIMKHSFIKIHLLGFNFGTADVQEWVTKIEQKLRKAAQKQNLSMIFLADGPDRGSVREAGRGGES